MRAFLLSTLLAGAGLGAQQPPATRKAASVPLVYCTDLFHPHDDPDDHLDLDFP